MSDASPLRHFVPAQDQPVLRQWILALKKWEHVNPSRLHRELREWLQRAGRTEAAAMSRSSIDRFLNGVSKSGIYKTDRHMGVLWEFLGAQASYLRHFPKRSAPLAASSHRSLPGHTGDGLTDQVPSADEPEKLLAFALMNFFRQDAGIVHLHDLELMKKVLKGRYVMYRPDLEPASDGEGLLGVRVSAVDIAAEGPETGLFIKETQDFPMRDNLGHYRQVNGGVIAPYGKFLIALMNCEGAVSFKCLVIEELSQFFGETPVRGFHGKILVASKRASFPSVKFVCKRALGQERFGYLNYEEIPSSIARQLQTPTFDAELFPVIS